MDNIQAAAQRLADLYGWIYAQDSDGVISLEPPEGSFYGASEN